MDMITTSQQTLPITTTSDNFITDYSIEFLSTATIRGKHFHDNNIIIPGPIIIIVEARGLYIDPQECIRIEAYK